MFRKKLYLKCHWQSAAFIIWPICLSFGVPECYSENIHNLSPLCLHTDWLVVAECWILWVWSRVRGHCLLAATVLKGRWNHAVVEESDTLKCCYCQRNSKLFSLEMWQRWEFIQTLSMTYIYILCIYIYSFGSRFYPKRLTREGQH